MGIITLAVLQYRVQTINGNEHDETLENNSIDTWREKNITCDALSLPLCMLYDPYDPHITFPYQMIRLGLSKLTLPLILA